MHGRCCRQASSVHYTTSCKHSLALLRMGEIIARNMLSWFKLLIKLLLLHLVGCLYYCVNDPRSHKHKKNGNETFKFRKTPRISWQLYGLWDYAGDRHFTFVRWITQTVMTLCTLWTQDQNMKWPTYPFTWLVIMRQEHSLCCQWPIQQTWLMHQHNINEWL